MFASVTRLRVRSVFYLSEFAWRTFLTQRQTVRADGFVGGRLLVERKYTVWTLTVWENEQTMKRFRGSGPHAKVMRKLPRWCDEASYAHWNTDPATIPSWHEAHHEEAVALQARCGNVEQRFHLPLRS